MARLDASDSPDNSFSPGLSGTLFGLTVQADGKIIASGEFGALGGAPATNVARLTADGTLDSTFQAAGVGFVNCMAIQADGKVLVGATVTANGLTTSNLARLWPDGSLDTTFNPTPKPYLAAALAVQADGKIIVGGSFTNLAGQPRKGLGRLNPEGTLDTTFVPIDYVTITAIGLQSDGKILIGGSRVDATGNTNNYVGRLQNTGPATESLSWDGSAITWIRGGTAPEVCATSFEASTNGTDWAQLGAGVRIPGGWRLAVRQIQPGSLIRASAAVSVGQFNGTSWFVQTSLQLPSTPAIIVNDGHFGFNSNNFGFNYSAPPGSTVIIEMSDDFLTWKAVGTNTVTVSPAYFNEPIPSQPQRFYRLRLSP